MNLIKSINNIPFRSLYVIPILVLLYNNTIHASNLDSLKSELSPTLPESSRCSILYSIFEILANRNPWGH